MLMLSSGSSGALSALEESKAIRDKFPFEPERVSYYIHLYIYLELLLLCSYCSNIIIVNLLTHVHPY